MVPPNLRAGLADLRLAMTLLTTVAGCGDTLESAVYWSTKSSMPTSARNGALRLSWLYCVASLAVDVVFSGTTNVVRTLAVCVILRKLSTHTTGEALHPWRAPVTPRFLFQSGV